MTSSRQNDILFCTNGTGLWIRCMGLNTLLLASSRSIFFFLFLSTHICRLTFFYFVRDAFNLCLFWNCFDQCFYNLLFIVSRILLSYVGQSSFFRVSFRIAFSRVGRVFSAARGEVLWQESFSCHVFSLHSFVSYYHVLS